jgi:hypothetical protein
MRKKFVILAAIAVIIVSVAVTVANMPDDQADVLRYDGTVLTQDIIAQSTISSLGTDESELYYDDGEMNFSLSFIWWYDPGHAVLFSPPKKPWTLDKVRIYGEYANLSALPEYYGIFALEIWDSDYNLLYKLTDYSQAYFANTGKWTEIDLPDQDLSDDFYVCFFERGSVFVGVDSDNPAKKSFLVMRGPNAMDNAVYTDENGAEKPFNWMIRAVGRKTS